jgi:hypothetical protein
MFERRRAERFAELVDESARQRRRHRRTEYDVELLPLAALAASLGDKRLAPSPGKEYRLGLRAMLMATIDREGIGVTAINPEERPTDRPWHLPTRPLPVTSARTPAGSTAGTRRRTRAAVLVGVTTGALVLSGVSMAATNTKPGDTFYPIKLQAERAQLAMAGSEMNRAQLYFRFAQARLREAHEVSGKLAVDALTAMQDDTTAGMVLLTYLATTSSGGDAAIEAIRDHRDILSAGLATLPDGAPSAANAMLTKITTRLDELRSFRDGKCVGSLSDDELGSKPLGCPAISQQHDANLSRRSRGGRLLDR